MQFPGKNLEKNNDNNDGDSVREMLLLLLLHIIISDIFVTRNKHKQLEIIIKDGKGE
jgi:hypothetical protein